MLVGLLIVFGGGIAALVAWQSGLLPERDTSFGAIEACEGNLKDGLMAPSTYRRLKVTHRQEPPLTFDEFRRFQETSYCGFEGVAAEPCTHANRITLAYAANERLKERGVNRPTRAQRDQER